MTFRVPAIQLQLVASDPYGRMNCAAYSGAMLADADSRGALIYSGRLIRAASNEPVPSPTSPGLNWSQVDDSLFRLSGGRVNLDVHPIGSPFSTLQTAMKAGRFAGVAVWREVLVKAGLGFTSPFGQGHAIVAYYDPDLRRPRYLDPLVNHPIDVTWALLEEAAAQLVIHSMGVMGENVGAYYALTRDLYDPPVTLKYSVTFYVGAFWVYQVTNGVITGRTRHAAFSHRTSAPAGPPGSYHWPNHGSRKLHRVTAGVVAGGYVEPGSTNIRVRALR